MVPVRVDGFPRLLLHRQLPGKIFRTCSIKLHPPLELAGFYSRPYEKTEGRRVVERLTELLRDPD